MERAGEIDVAPDSGLTETRWDPIMSDTSAEAWPDITTTKLDAAKQQLDTGIRLLFAREDSLSTHTLAFAAYGLLKGIAERTGRSATLRSIEADAQLRADFWKELNRLSNFLKHAKDASEPQLIEGIPEEFNETCL